MPNTREMELWRLVNKAFQNSIEKFGDIFAKDVTRDLLANGVTVQNLDGCEYCKEDRDGYRKMIGAFAITNPFHILYISLRIL